MTNKVDFVPVDACERVIERLVDGTWPAMKAGEAPDDDAALVAHAKTCLSCFRAVSAWKDWPKLEKRMRSVTPADPGAAFWDGFAARVGDAWDATRAPSRDAAALSSSSDPTRVPAPRATSWIDGWGARLRASLRAPWPAALGGAAVAGLAVFLAARLDGPRAPLGGAANVGGHAAAVVGARDHVQGGDVDQDDEQVLDLPLLGDDALALDDGDSVAAGDEHDDDLVLSPVEAVERLEPGELKAVARALEASRI